VISGLCREVDENCAASGGNFLVRNYHYSLRNNPEERSFQVGIEFAYKYA